MQGWRISMEDAHTAVLDLDSAKSHSSKLSFFGVFDGHGGDKVALFTGQNIHNIIFKQDTFKSGDYAQGLKDGFLATDRAILNGMRQLLVLFCSPFGAQRYFNCHLAF
jgi:protein phosphatase 2C family protein 2/3